MNGRLRLEPWTERPDGCVELAATLELADRPMQRLWWRVPSLWRDALTTFADPFVIGFAFPMMQAGGEIEIDAPVSPSLLANLESFMDVWRMWVPGKYERPRLLSKDEREPPEAERPASFVMPFSAGVDSCFTALQHVRGLAGRNTKKVGLGVTMFGFDIQVQQNNAASMYAQLRADAASMLASLGLPHVEIETNFRTLPSLWLHSHGTQLASGLALFGRRFGGALIPNSLPANQLATLWGSHPYSDPMTSSDRFRIVDDGAAVARWEKIDALANWPEAMAGLRVCFGVSGKVGNCGECEKCIRTALAFKICDITPPAGLPNDVPARRMRRISLRHDIAIGFWRDLEAGIRVRGKQAEPWASEVRRVLRRAKRRRVTKAAKQQFVPLRNKIRALFRGTTLSKSQRVNAAADQSRAEAQADISRS